LAGINGDGQCWEIGDTVGVGIAVGAVGDRISQTGVDTHDRDRAGVLTMHIRKFKRSIGVETSAARSVGSQIKWTRITRSKCIHEVDAVLYGGEVGVI